MNTKISEEVVDIDKLADVLSLYDDCKTLLTRLAEFVSCEDNYKEINNLSQVIKNSMPTKDEKREAGKLVSELRSAEQVLLNWYSKFYKKTDYKEIMDNSDLIQSDYFFLRKNLIGQNKTITFKEKSGKNAGERVTYNHDAVVALNREYLDNNQKNWEGESGFYNNTSNVPGWCKLK